MPIRRSGMTTVSIRLTSLIEWTVAVWPGARSSARASSREMTVRSAPVSTMKSNGPRPSIRTGTVIRLLRSSVRPSVSACCRSATVGAGMAGGAAGRATGGGASWARDGAATSQSRAKPRKDQGRGSVPHRSSPHIFMRGRIDLALEESDGRFDERRPA